MLGVPISLDEVSIVLKGGFNPSILSPAWLLAQGVIGAAEEGESDVDVITRDIAAFSCAWIKLFATADTLQLSTAVEAEFERLRDACVAILKALPHTPIAVLGINRSVHFRVDSLEQLHRVGDTLAPKDVWGDVLDFPGMRSLTVWGARPGTQAGRISVTIEPSNAIPQAIFVAHNDHYELSERTDPPSGRDEAWSVGNQPATEATPGKLSVAVEILTDNWKDSMNRGDKVIRRVYEQGEK